MRKRKNNDKKQNSDRWLMTYSDMMNNLLVLFMVLYAISVLDMAKFKVLAQELSNTFSNTPMTEEAVPPEYDELISEVDALEEVEEVPKEILDDFDKVYEALKEEIAEEGYAEQVLLEKGGNYIKIRFGDNVLFYPDSPVIKSEEVGVLQVIGNILSEVNPLIQSIEIAGHTATTGEYTDSFFSWELSAQRAIAVLKYFAQKCALPEGKMYISGFSRYHPIASNDTEASRQLNRRVEIKITRVNNKTPNNLK